MKKEGLVWPAAALGRARLCMPCQQREEDSTGQLGTAGLGVRQLKAQASISASAFQPQHFCHHQGVSVYKVAKKAEMGVG